MVQLLSVVFDLKRLWGNHPYQPRNVIPEGKLLGKNSWMPWAPRWDLVDRLGG